MRSRRFRARLPQHLLRLNINGCNLRGLAAFDFGPWRIGQGRRRRCLSALSRSPRVAGSGGHSGPQRPAPLPVCCRETQPSPLHPLFFGPAACVRRSVRAAPVLHDSRLPAPPFGGGAVCALRRVKTRCGGALVARSSGRRDTGGGESSPGGILVVTGMCASAGTT